MAYRKFRANRLFDGYRFQDSDRVLITDEKGVIHDLVRIEDAGDDVAFYDGILSPGFINCHCHLELSHLKNVIPPHTGLIEFLCSVVTKRGFDPEIIQAEIARADAEMYANGIVAVGDIGNTADTATVKSKSGIRWQNFVEVLSFTDAKAAENFDHYRSVAQQMQQALNAASLEHRTSLVPHAPYTISPETFRMINEATAGQVISIHNQEHPAEDELYRTGGGAYLKLFSIFDLHASPFPVTGMSSIRSVLPYFNKEQTIFLVHNTFMPEEDIIWANAYASENGLKLIYCLCINANLYIENQTPPVDLFLKHNCTVVLGTDSYSSNWQLSIAKEMASLKLHKGLEDEQVLRFATMNGAKALKWDDVLGSFEKGKEPGVVLLSNDFQQSSRLL
jgi:cytosine/adenosine deaminase-related metal-dependent hydrolase